MPNWELQGCCDRDQKAFLVTIGIYTVVILVVRFSLCFLNSLSKKSKNTLLKHNSQNTIVSRTVRCMLIHVYLTVPDAILSGVVFFEGVFVAFSLFCSF